MAGPTLPPTATPCDPLRMTPIKVAALFPPTAIRVDLYLGGGSLDWQPRLYSRAAAPPSARDLEALQRSGVTTLYTPASQAAELQEQFHHLLDSGAAMSPEVHLEVAREAAKGNLARAWNAGQTDEMIAEAAHFADAILEVCAPCENTAALVRSLLKHDGDTFTHVSNVCVYTLMLLRKLGIASEPQLIALGQAALLHDLGKRAISKDILKKPGALTPAERATMSEHPRLGFEELCTRPDLDRDQLLMAYHHHEKLDGTGYPVGLVGEEIHWTGRLCAVIDVFDALTGRRPYRKPATAEEALAVLHQGTGRHFDGEFVRCWTDVLGGTAA